jgi:hypothetical protein
MQRLLRGPQGCYPLLLLFLQVVEVPLHRFSLLVRRLQRSIELGNPRILLPEGCAVTTLVLLDSHNAWNCH